MMLISSPPCGPCSCVQSAPVCGCSAAPCMLRWPRSYFSCARCSWPRSPRREVEEARAVEHDAPAEMQAARGLRLLYEQHSQILQPLAVELGARELGARPALARTGVREVDEAVLGEARVQRDLEQAALPARVHARHAFDAGALEVAA